MDVLKTLKVRGLIDIYIHKAFSECWVSVCLTQIERVKGLSILRQRWPVQVFLTHRHTQRPPPGDNGCVQTTNKSSSRHIKDLSRHSTKAPLRDPCEDNFKVFHRGELHSVTLLFSWGPLHHPQGLNHKNSNEIGGTFQQPPKWKTPPVLFSCKLKSYRTYPLSSCYKPGTQCSSRGGMKPPRSAQVTATNQGWNLQAKDRDWV